MFPPGPEATVKLTGKATFDPEANTVTLEGPTPPELKELGQGHGDRLGVHGFDFTVYLDDPKRMTFQKRLPRPDFLSRFKGYTESCLRCVLPHYGPRPEHIPAEAWDDWQWRVRHVALPKDAPGTAHDALLALQAGQRVVDHLAPLDDWPEAIDSVFSELIDFGQLLQRMDDRRFEHSVGAHHRQDGTLARGRKAGAAQLKQATDAEYENIRQQFQQFASTRNGGRISPTGLRKLFAARIGVSESKVRRALRAKARK